jgi:hypothetical protein
MQEQSSGTELVLLLKGGLPAEFSASVPKTFFVRTQLWQRTKAALACSLLPIKDRVPLNVLYTLLL